MSRRRSNRQNEEAEVNMTPMLDIVFILLIFFIVTATFLNEKGFDLTPPPPSDSVSKTLPSIRVYVDQSNLIQIDGRYIDIGSLRANMERRKAETPGISLVVQAHPEANNEFVIRTIDMAKSADIQNIALVGSSGE